MKVHISMLSRKARFYLTHPAHLWRSVTEKLVGSAPRRFELKTLLGVLPERATIIEAGASRGMDTVEMATLWPAARILAFEPEPITFNQLKEETSRFPNVECFPLALSTCTGTATLHRSASDGNPGSSDASSLLKPTGVKGFWPHLAFSTSVQVATVTLEDFLREHDIARVDFMWLDMQGMEMACLEASKNIMHVVDRIYCEVFLQQMYDGTPLYPEAKQIMARLGFRVAQEYLNPLQGDVLFVRRGLSP